MSAYTPGPWKTIPSPNSRDYRCVQLGKDEQYTTLELEPADARLIAAAPDLLAALVEVWKDSDAFNVQHGITRTPHMQRMYLRAQAVIRKATDELHAPPPEANPAPDVASASRSDETTDRRVRASSAGGEEK